MNENEYRAARARLDAYQSAQEALFPGKCSFTQDDVAAICARAGLASSPTNAERGEVEEYQWRASPPDKYFVYVSEAKRVATTWTGDVLGEVGFGREFRDNFGGKRVPITVYGTNGRMYHGTYYKSAGDYARIKAMKSKASA